MSQDKDLGKFMENFLKCLKDVLSDGESDD